MICFVINNQNTGNISNADKLSNDETVSMLINLLL